MNRLAAVFAALASAATASHASDPPADLLKYLPQDANTIGIIRVAEILKSPRARAEGWAREQQEQFLAGAAVIPPWVQTTVIGAHVHPGPEAHGWTVALVKLRRQVQMSLVAEHERSTVEQLAGFDVVASSRNAYFVGLPPDVVGVRSPAFRQDTSRWIRSIAGGRASQLSPYLVEAASSEEHIVLALDTRDMADPRRLRERLQASPTLAGTPEAIDRLHRLLMGQRGVRFTATVGEDTQARIHFDFAEAPGATAEHIKTLFLEFLNDQGALLEDLLDSRVSTSGRSVVLSLTLSDGGLRRILSLLLSPNLEVQSQAAPQPGAGEPAPAVRRARESDLASSRRYFDTIEKILADLKRSLRRAKEYERTAQWHENFAEKIDGLPMVGVDPALLEYGASVSSRLRALAASLRGQAVEVNTQERTVTWNVNVDPGWAAASWWGAAGYRAPSWQATSNLQEVRQHQAEAVARGAQQRLDIWQIIDDQTAEVHRHMLEKFGPEFDHGRPRS